MWTLGLWICSYYIFQNSLYYSKILMLNWTNVSEIYVMREITQTTLLYCIILSIASDIIRYCKLTWWNNFSYIELFSYSIFFIQNWRIVIILINKDNYSRGGTHIVLYKQTKQSVPFIFLRGRINSFRKTLNENRIFTQFYILPAFRVLSIISTNWNRHLLHYKVHSDEFPPFLITVRKMKMLYKLGPNSTVIRAPFFSNPQSLNGLPVSFIHLFIFSACDNTYFIVGRTAVQSSRLIGKVPAKILKIYALRFLYYLKVKLIRSDI